MELVNLLLIIATSALCLTWAWRKKLEIESLTVEMEEEGALFDQERRKAVEDEQEDLEYAAKIFQRALTEIIRRLTRLSLCVFGGVALLIWLFLDDKLASVAQPVFFMAGAGGQLLIGLLIFGTHRLFDPRVITFSRVSKWHALDHLSRLNGYLTLANQACNLVLFSTTYYLSTFFGIDISAATMTEREFERFHRRFLCFGLGSVFAFFVVKSLSTAVTHGSALVVETLARQSADGIEEDHPKNPAQIMLNLGEGFLRSLHNALELNALTNMGLCIFQDFFVTRSVYLLDRGFLNGTAIYSVGMLGALAAIELFRRLNRYQISDSCEFSAKLARMRRSAVLCVLLAVGVTSLGAFLVMWNTFPDAIAVYDPFERKIALRNLNSMDSFLMFLTSALIVLALMANSLFFTGRTAVPARRVAEAGRVSFSLTLLSADYWSCYAAAGPMAVFFVVLYLNYRRGNIYGVTMEYLGLLTYFQVIVYFQNFKNVHFFGRALLMARRVEDATANRNFQDVVHICCMLGKLSNGVSLFVMIILCFVILLDGFNLQIVKSIVVIDPFYIFGLCAGCVLFCILAALELRTQENFARFLLRQIKLQVQHRLGDEDYDPPIEGIAAQGAAYAYTNQLLFYHLPVLAAIAFIFSLFGKKMTVIVLFGCFLFVLFTCYPLLLKSELLVDLRAVAEERTGPAAAGHIAVLSNIVGQANRHHGHDSFSKLLLLFCACMLCSQYFIEQADFLHKLATPYLEG